MCDYSSFAKLDIWSAGTEVVDFLQYLCSNDAFFIDSRHKTSNLYIKPLKRGKTTIILSVQLDNYILEKNRKKKEICHGLTTQNN